MKEKIVTISILLAITLLGAFLRLYHFPPYLHFELDQARDTIFVSEAVKNGPIELPLLGPKASGTNLRVGPAYYYLEYLSALTFGDTPAGHALFVVLFSIASIPLLYLLFKKFFATYISLGLTYLYAISAFFVLFSRFSWNPNLLPPAIIAGLYCLLRSFESDAKYPGRWFTAAVFCFALATQLHFIAFVAAPIFLTLFLILKRPRFSWKAWTASLAIVFVLYVPVIANEIKFQGENTKAFFAALQEKNNENHNLVEKIVQNILSESESYALMLSGNDHIVTPKLNLQSGKKLISCADYCRKTPRAFSLLAVLFFVAGASLLLKKSWKNKNGLGLLGLWFIITLLIFTTLAYELPARFFLLAAPLPFIFLGLLIAVLQKKHEVLTKIIFALILIGLSSSNFSYLTQRFSQLSHADREIVKIPSDNILEEPARVTLLQQQQIAVYLFTKYQENGYPIDVVYAEPFYRRSIKYLADKLGAPIAKMDLAKQQVYAQSNPVIIVRTTNHDEKIFGKYAQYFDTAGSKQFGTLTVYTLSPKADKITSQTPKTSSPAGGDTGDILRITWRDL